MHTKIAFVTHLNRRTGKSCGAHVLDRDHGTGLHQLQTSFHQTFFSKRISDLYCGAFLFDRIVKLGAGHRGATDAVAAGLSTQIYHRHAYTRGSRVKNLVRVSQTCCKCIDQTIAVIGRIESNLTADSRYAKAIAISTDA